MSKKTALAALALAAAALPFAAHADTPAAATAGSADAAASAMSEGVVRKVNKEAQKITVRHGELKNLGMPPMTMVFRVADPAFLDQVQAGDEVNFVAEKIGGQFTIVRIEPKH